MPISMGTCGRTSAGRARECEAGFAAPLASDISEVKAEQLRNKVQKVGKDGTQVHSAVAALDAKVSALTIALEKLSTAGCAAGGEHASRGQHRSASSAGEPSRCDIGTPPRSSEARGSTGPAEHIVLLESRPRRALGSGRRLRRLS